MYINLGGDKVVATKHIVAIFNITLEQSSPISKQFLTQAAREGKVEVVDHNVTKSLVITNDKVYYSSISATTLIKKISMSKNRK